MSDPRGISVCLIVKNCFDQLVACLDSLKPFVRTELGDEIVIVDTGSTDNTPDVAGARVLRHPELSSGQMLELVKKYLPEHYERAAADQQSQAGFLTDFAAARQLGTDAAKNDLIFWIDADDTLAGAKDLRDYCLTFFSNPQYERAPLFLPYDYCFDVDGTCNTILWRERILDRRFYEWRGVCHETLVPKDGIPVQVVRCPLKQCRIRHTHGRHHSFSDVRNYAILRNAYDNATWKDPRWEFYLGNASRGLERWDESIQWYCLTLKHSGSRDDRYAATLNIGSIYLLMRRPWRAIDWFWQAMKIHPEDARAYYAVARCYFELRRYGECLFWTGIGHQLGEIDHITSIDPHGFDFYPYVFEALALKEVGDLVRAHNVAKLARERRPNFAPAQELESTLAYELAQASLKGAIVSTLKVSSSPDSAMKIVKALKPEVRRGIVELQVEEVCTKPKRSITYLCGKTFEPWDGTSPADGIGGSEKMVIALAKRWADAGWAVDVYGHPKPENAYKKIDGVTYRPVEAFNPKLERDVLVLWRNLGYLDAARLRARKIFADLHDVLNPADFPAHRLEKLDGIFVKSVFHGRPIADIAGKKLIVSRNGIDCSHFTGQPPERNLRKIVYCSSADRGLLGALRIWQRIEREFSDAEFHIFYGFTPLYLSRAAEIDYQYFGDEGCERHMLDYSEECFTAIDKSPRAFLRGRVSHETLATELRTAGIWLYPTRFPEISCMAAMEAQAAGALPVCSDSGALKETVTFGHIISTQADHFEDRFVTAIRNLFAKGHDLDDYREDMKSDAFARFSLDPLATEWLEHFSESKRTNRRRRRSVGV